MKTKFPRAKALRVAKELCEFLRPVTEWLIVAGSLRRGAQEVGDIEILFIPKMLPGKRVDMFETPPMVNAAQITIAQVAKNKVIAPRQNVNGRDAAWGPKNKLAVHVATTPTHSLTSLCRPNVSP